MGGWRVQDDDRGGGGRYIGLKDRRELHWHGCSADEGHGGEGGRGRLDTWSSEGPATSFLQVRFARRESVVFAVSAVTSLCASSSSSHVQHELARQNHWPPLPIWGRTTGVGGEAFRVFAQLSF